MRLYQFLIVISVFVYTNSSKAQLTSLYEPFSDEISVEDNWNEVDNTRGTDWGPGDFLLEHGTLNIVSGDVVPKDAPQGANASMFYSWVLAAESENENGVLRVTGRANENGNGLMHGLRLSGSLLAYAFHTDEDGLFQIGSFRGEVPGVVHASSAMNQERFQTGEDWIIEGATIEDRITMKFWRLGQPEPIAPQLAFLDPDPIFASNGQVLIGGVRDRDFDGDAPIDLTFDDAHFRVVEKWIDGDYSINQVLDVADIDKLTQIARSKTNDQFYDLNGDQLVDQSDRIVWVKDLRNSYFGDANLDGEFNSTDLVAVFQPGKFEFDVAAGWSEGDWDGDGKFGTGDLVFAFQDGGYEQGPQANTVPEPTPLIMLVALLGIMTHRKRIELESNSRAFLCESRIRKGRQISRAHL